MLNKLFRRMKKPKAMIFVDFEYWCISLQRIYGQSPNIRDCYSALNDQFNIRQILFFGDFTNNTLRTHIDEIRNITNDIIDTQNPSVYTKKDYTDFIMLDYIYQTADERKNINTYILFTGDGHFSSVARYLKVRKKKKVLIYGVTGSISNKLRAAADECVEMPSAEEVIELCKKRIVENFNYLATRKNSRPVYPTFQATVANVAQHYNLAADKVEAALQGLIDTGIIVRKDTRVDFVRTVRTLSVNWTKAIEAGFWDPERA